MNYSDLSPEEIRDKMFRTELVIVRQQREIEARQQLIKDSERKMQELRRAYMNKVLGVPTAE